ncbi:MAG: 30S ribosomal protein S13 [Deltaproteobacteria bacterium]|nr:30S ribosomal protein S13 [Deltaproteobacteria bacterium]
MVRIAGVDIPGQKRTDIALRYLYGIGPTLASSIVEEAGIDPATKSSELSEAQLARIREIIEGKYPVEGELRRQIGANIKMLKDLGSHRGSRHIRRLPLKGRTHSNARTAKGRKRVPIAGRKKAPTAK